MSIANLKKNGAMDVKDRIYVDILTKIMTGDFGPKYRLTEDSLAKQFHVSRTPVREVLVALEKDGLIHREPNRGATVVAFTPEDVEDIYEIRNALECCAIRRGVRGIKMSKLLDLKRELGDILNSEPQCPGDGNVDGVVDKLDLKNWTIFQRSRTIDGSSGPSSSWYDFNLPVTDGYDGVTNHYDRKYIQENLGRTCPAR